MTLLEAANNALDSGFKTIREFYSYLQAAGFGRESYLDARLEAGGIVKDLGGGYFRRVLAGPVAPYHLTAAGQAPARKSAGFDDLENVLREFGVTVDYNYEFAADVLTLSGAGIDLRFENASADLKKIVAETRAALIAGQAVAFCKVCRLTKPATSREWCDDCDAVYMAEADKAMAEDAAAGFATVDALAAPATVQDGDAEAFHIGTSEAGTLEIFPTMAEARENAKTLSESLGADVIIWAAVGRHLEAVGHVEFIVKAPATVQAPECHFCDNPAVEGLRSYGFPQCGCQSPDCGDHSDRRVCQGLGCEYGDN